MQACLVDEHLCVITEKQKNVISSYPHRKFFTGKPLESNLHRNFADLCKSIDKEGRKAFNPHPKLSTMVYNIMSTITFGDK